MKKTPATPFSTPLSGNAKETEMRFKSILKWKKSRPPIFALILVLAVSILCCSMVACHQSGQTPTETTPVSEISDPTVHEIAGSGPSQTSPQKPTQPPTLPVFLKLNAGDHVPEGCSYVTASGETLNPGDPMPKSVQQNDRFMTPQFVYQGYMCHVTAKGIETELGWLAWLNEENVNRTEITELSETMYEMINGLPLLSMMGTYRGCSNLVRVPPIPNTVRDMTGTFLHCFALEYVPNLPESLDNLSAAFTECNSIKIIPDIPTKVVAMDNAFENCSSLERTPDFSRCTELQQFNYVFEGCSSLKETCDIPACITVMNGTFKGCSALTGTITVHTTKLADYSCKDIFTGCRNLTLTGSCPPDVLEAMAETGTNITVK